MTSPPTSYTTSWDTIKVVAGARNRDRHLMEIQG